MPLYEVALLSFVALITMVNPLAVIPSFVAITEGGLRKARRTVALFAGIATAGVLLVFLLAGNYVFQFFGITIPAFQIMGGTLFFASALRTLMEDEHRIRSLIERKREEPPPAPGEPETKSVDPIGVAVVPLGVPMLAGPGAITSVMVLVNLYRGIGQRMAVVLAILAVGLVSYLTLLAAVPLSRFIGERGRAVFQKVMALLLGAIGIQLIINGVKPLLVEIVKAGG